MSGNVLSYRGYSARVAFDAGDGIFFGRVAGVRDVVGFHAETVADLVAAFREAVDDYIDACAKIGKTTDRPFSGKLMLRIDPQVHARAAHAAEIKGVSLNQWSEAALARAAESA